MTSTPARRTLIQSNQVRQKLGGICDMTLWRILKNERLDFPRPIVINRRRYWEESDVDRWIELQRDAAA